MNQLLMRIDEVQNFIFDFEMKSFMESIAKLTDELVEVMNLLDENKLKNLNEIVYYMNLALNNRDYLLYSDILEYELKYFIKQA